MDYTPNKAQSLITPFECGHNAAFILAGMGTGKTAATLDYIKALLTLDIDTGALIVAPKNVSILSWPAEIRKWKQWSDLRVAMLRDDITPWVKGSADVYIINYDQLDKLGKKAPCKTAIFDESWMAKNPAAKRINRFRRNLAHAFERRVGLNGTPRPNCVSELFAQVRLLDGGKHLGAKWTKFIDEFFNKNKWTYKITPRPGAEAEIYKRIADMTLILKSSDYLDLVPITFVDVYVDLPPTARKHYDEMEKSAITMLDAGEIVGLSGAAVLGKLMQIASGCVYDADRKVHTIHKAKLEALKELLKEGNMLTLTAYVHECDKIVEEVGAVKFTTDLIPSWDRGEIPHMVSNYVRVASGLNLQAGGCHITWMTLPFSPLYYEQANARLHRTGQTEPVTVYRVIARDTVDEAVVETLRNKTQSQDDMLDHEAFHAVNVLTTLKKMRQ